MITAKAVFVPSPVSTAVAEPEQETLKRLDDLNLREQRLNTLSEVLKQREQKLNEIEAQLQQSGGTSGSPKVSQASAQSPNLVAEAAPQTVPPIAERSRSDTAGTEDAIRGTSAELPIGSRSTSPPSRPSLHKDAGTLSSPEKAAATAATVAAPAAAAATPSPNPPGAQPPVAATAGSKTEQKAGKKAEKKHVEKKEKTYAKKQEKKEKTKQGCYVC